MPKTSAQQYKFDTDGETMPSTLHTRGTEGKIKLGNSEEVLNPPLGRSDPSDAVGSDSLPGFVRRNISTFEKTEGRL